MVHKLPNRFIKRKHRRDTIWALLVLRIMVPVNRRSSAHTANGRVGNAGPASMLQRPFSHSSSPRPGRTSLLRAEIRVRYLLHTYHDTLKYLNENIQVQLPSSSRRKRTSNDAPPPPSVGTEPGQDCGRRALPRRKCRAYLSLPLLPYTTTTTTNLLHHHAK